MRKIKFRAKSEEAGGWVYGYYIRYDNGPAGVEHVIQTKGRYYDDILPETLGQFIGLKDKNGKEIYEGDIVETVTASGNPFGTIDVVRYQDGGFKLVDDTDSLLPIYIGDKEVISIEVIGNIYEDKHLLEESS